MKKTVLILSLLLSLLPTLQAQETEFDVVDFYNSYAVNDFYNRLNNGQPLPDDLQTLKHLQYCIRDTLAINQKFSDKNGNNNLEIKVINPCRLAENFEYGSDDFWKYFRVDGWLNYIVVSLTNKNYSDTLIYYNPGVAMSLINLLENNISLKSVSNKQAVLIPFAYCVSAGDDEAKIAYIVFYDHKKYFFHIILRGENFENYKVADDLNEKFKDLPKKLKKELIGHIKENATKILPQ